MGIPEQEKHQTVGVTEEAASILQKIKHGRRTEYASQAILAYSKREGKHLLEMWKK